MGREGEDVLCSLKLTEDEGKNYEHATMYRLGRESVLSGEFAFIVFSGHPVSQAVAPSLGHSPNPPTL